MAGTASTRCHCHAGRRAPGDYPFGNYHIRDGRGLGIVHYIRAAWIGGFDRTILTETKITDQDYCRNRMGCDVVCSKAIISADGDEQEGVGTTVGDQTQGWSIDSTRFYGPNVVRCEVVAGKRTSLIRAYFPPSSLEHLPDLAEALIHSWDQEP